MSVRLRSVLTLLVFLPSELLSSTITTNLLGIYGINVFKIYMCCVLIEDIKLLGGID